MRNLSKSILFPTQIPAGDADKVQKEEARDRELPEIQLQLRSESRLMQFRELGVSQHLIRWVGLLGADVRTADQATSISQLVRLPGIVISASVLASRATKLHLTCKGCRHVTSLSVSGGFSGFTLPRVCLSCVLLSSPLRPFLPCSLADDGFATIKQETIEWRSERLSYGSLRHHSR